jgi:hypothetical protein
MKPRDRVLTVICAALLIAGVAGVAVHHPARTTGPVRPAAAVTTAPTTGVPTTGDPATTLAPVAGPASTVLAGDLVTPTDMGGYYSTEPGFAATFLDSAGCLASLQPSPAQSGRAATALLGPDRLSVPVMVEDVASYPSGGAAQVYRAVGSAITSCATFSFDFGGSRVVTHLEPFAIPPVGGADQVWSGTFSYGGDTLGIQAGVVLDPPDLLALVWMDTLPPSAAIMGNFTSTLSLAIGKLA